MRKKSRWRQLEKKLEHGWNGDEEGRKRRKGRKNKMKGRQQR